jgi:predicted transcriptional regulator
MILIKKIKHELYLLERHVRILKILDEKGPIGIVKLSKITSIPPHQVRHSLRVLQQSGLLEPSTSGAVLNNKAKKFIIELEKEKKKIYRSIKEL